MSQPTTASLSLLSLSLAAANAQPISLPPTDPTTAHSQAYRHPSRTPSEEDDLDPASASADASGSSSYPKRFPHPHRAPSQPRRLSSASSSRRRLSDARDAAARPLSGTSPATAMTALSLDGHGQESEVVQVDDEGKQSKGRKRPTLFTCESCSKVYRHPSCLIKHRWEHTPHWREASKLMLSKHQQVQLMEAAAILSHLSPSSSLPSDRSLWPSFISGGTLPGAPQTVPPPSTSSPSHPSATRHTASSVPTRGGVGGAGGGGPRMYDYAVPASVAPTTLRPGVLAVAVPTPTSAPISKAQSQERVMTPYGWEPEADVSGEKGEKGVGMDMEMGTHRYPPRYGSVGDERWSSSIGTGEGTYASLSSFASVGTPPSFVSVSVGGGGGGGEEGFVDVRRFGREGGGYGEDVDVEEVDGDVKEEEEEEEEEWDGMEMEMEM